MEKYIGTKIVSAHPQWSDSNQEQGYAVGYGDGYLSWSPKSAFDKAYRMIAPNVASLTFGDAVHLLKLGHKVTRAGWNGKGMFLFLVPGSQFKVSRPPLLGIYPEGTEINYRPHIDMKTADGSVSTWNPTCNDVLAEDWMVVE